MDEVVMMEMGYRREGDEQRSFYSGMETRERDTTIRARPKLQPPPRLYHLLYT